MGQNKFVAIGTSPKHDLTEQYGEHSLEEDIYWLMRENTPEGMTITQVTEDLNYDKSWEPEIAKSMWHLEKEGLLGSVKEVR